MNQEHDPELAALPAPPIDQEFSARVQRRARSALRDRGLLPRERAVPALMLIAGIAYTAVSVEMMIRLFG